MKVGLVHVPYKIRGGEEAYVDMLRLSYGAIGTEVVPIPALGGESGGLKQAAGSLLNGDPASWDSLRTVDFLHLNNIHPVLGPAFLRWIISRRIPAVMTVHNHRFYCTNGLALYGNEVCKACQSKASLTRPILWNCNGSYAKSAYHSIALHEIRRENLLNRAVKIFLAPSRYIAHELEAAGVAAKSIRLFPHAVDVSAAGDASQDIASDIVFVGRLSEEKGVRHLLSAASQLPKTRFAIVGEGPLEDLVEEAKARLPNIRFHGKLGRPEALAILRSAKVACVPSICHESFSLIAAEALSLGLRLVVPDTESFLHFSEPPISAIKANVRNPADLAAALEKAADLPKRSAQETAMLAAHFTPAEFQARLKKIIEEVKS